jgi:hypothetical protein
MQIKNNNKITTSTTIITTTTIMYTSLNQTVKGSKHLVDDFVNIVRPPVCPSVLLKVIFPSDDDVILSLVQVLVADVVTLPLEHACSYGCDEAVTRLVH